jgi:hypothetical protein
MGYLDPRLSRLLAERMVAEARQHARPRRERRGIALWHRLETHLGAWMIATGEKLIRQDAKVA